MEHVRAVYRVHSTPGEIGERAAELALEQTAELPDAAVRQEAVRERVLGRVAAIRAEGEALHLVEIDYPEGAFDGGAAQLLNVLFGNSSLQPDVELLDVILPNRELARYGGPRFGIAGLREAAGVAGRPLTCAALKPIGLSPDELGRLAEVFALGGIDVVKDDHGLADQPSATFEERVTACQAALDRVADATGRRTLYVAHASGTPDRIRAQIEFATEAGAGAVMIEPMIAGLPFFHDLVKRTLAIPVLAHPALAGATRMAPDVLLGRLFRLFGADGVVFPHSGGRFRYTEETCRRLADRLREPWAGLRSALPVPAGGMPVERVGEIVEFYGRDVMLLLGGSLYLAGERLGDRTREFVEAVAAAVPEGTR